MEKLKEGLARFRECMLMVLFMISFTACDDSEDNTSTLISAQDSTFAIDAAYSNLAEIEMGELAASKATHGSIRAFGESMVAEHLNAQNQLTAIANERGIALPDTLNNADFILHRQLSALSSAAFDTAYINSQVAAHQQAQQRYNTQINQGQNTQLVGYASATLPNINMHLERATELRDEILAQ